MERQEEERDDSIDRSEGEEEDGEEEFDESSEGEDQGPTFVSQIRMRSNRGNKVAKLMKNEKMAHDNFWVENDYFGSKLA